MNVNWLYMLPNRYSAITLLPNKFSAITLLPNRNSAITLLPNRYSAITLLPNRNSAITLLPNRNSAITPLPNRNSAITLLPNRYSVRVLPRAEGGEQDAARGRRWSGGRGGHVPVPGWRLLFLRRPGRPLLDGLLHLPALLQGQE